MRLQKVRCAGANAGCRFRFDQAMKFDYHFGIAALAASRRS
jgi:hypothetical protein